MGTGSLASVTHSYLGSICETAGTQSCSQWSSVIWEPSARPAGAGNLLPASCSYSRKLSEDLGSWKSALRYPLTTRNNLWGLWETALCVQQPVVIWEPRVRHTRTGKLCTETYPNPGTINEACRAWSCTQWPTHSWETTPKPTEISSLDPETCSHQQSSVMSTAKQVTSTGIN